MPLTDTAIRAAKPSDRVQKISDGGGLQLWVTPEGGKLWCLAYRFDGKQKKLSIGAYPTITLALARKKRDDAKALLASGIDPGQQKAVEKLTKANSSAQTFDVVSKEVLDKKQREGKAPNTLSKLTWLHGLAVADLGKRPIAEITAAEVLASLKKIEATGRRESAKRLRAVVGEVFRYAIATGRVSSDPTSALRGALAAPIVKHRAAITDPQSFGALLRAIDGFEGQPTTVMGLKLLALLFPRPGELRQAEWNEFDLSGAVWTIPASRAKMRREHRIPLPRQALGVLAELRSITGWASLALPGYGISGGIGRKVGQRPISENTLNGALRRMGYGPDEMTSHGFRSTASTMLNESGLFSADAIERALAHQDQDPIRRAYARGEFWDERVRMMQWWADHLDKLRTSVGEGQNPGSQVRRPLHRSPLSF